MNQATQTHLVHSLLKSGPITWLHAFRMCGTSRLSARIYDLKAQGVSIETKLIKQGNARIAQYKLTGWKPTYVEPGV